MSAAAAAWATGTSDKTQIATLGPGADQRFIAVSGGSVTFAGLSCTGSVVPTDARNMVTNSPVTNVLVLAKIHKITFSGCAAAGGAHTPVQIGDWELHGISSATNNPTDLVKVLVDSIGATVPNPICTDTVAGRSTGTFYETTRVLASNETVQTGSLVVSDVSPSCRREVLKKRQSLT